MKRDENILAETMAMIKSMWRNRPGHETLLSYHGKFLYKIITIVLHYVIPIAIMYSGGGEYMKKIRVLREAKKMSYKELSERTGLSQLYIKQLENDEKSPTIRTLEKLANGLNVKVVDLLDEAATKIASGE